MQNHNNHHHHSNSRRLPQSGNTGSSLPSSNSTSPESRPPSPYNDTGAGGVSRTRASNKRLRKTDAPGGGSEGSRGNSPPPPPSKRQKMVNGKSNLNATAEENTRGTAVADNNSNCDKNIGKGVIHSEAKTTNNGHSNSVEARNNRRKTRSSVNNAPTDMLEQQMLSVINAGSKKVKSTREIVAELAARSHSPGLVSRTTAASSATGSVESSAPETQSELMSRFFRSQQNGVSAPPSPTSTSRGEPSTTAPTSGTTTPRSLLPQGEDPVSYSISEVMSRLPVISSSEVLSELKQERESSDDEEEEDNGDGGDDGLEVEGLIPVKRREEIEVTPDLVGRLHDTHMENFNGNTDHNGEFREWNEVVSKETTEGELLYVLPYSVIE